MEDKEYLPHTQHVQFGCDSEWLDRRMLDSCCQPGGCSAGPKERHSEYTYGDWWEEHYPKLAPVTPHIFLTMV